MLREPAGADTRVYRVYFSTLDGAKLGPMGGRILWLIRLLSLNRIAHCAVGDGRVVLSIDLFGARFWPVWTFQFRFPGLVAVVDVPGKPVPLRWFEAPEHRKPCWPSFWRWLKGGEDPWTEDCLCTTLHVLAAMGVPVPHYLKTPIALLRWLKETGYGYAERREATSEHPWTGPLARKPVPRALAGSAVRRAGG